MGRCNAGLATAMLDDPAATGVRHRPCCAQSRGKQASKENNC